MTTCKTMFVRHEQFKDADVKTLPVSLN